MTLIRAAYVCKACDVTGRAEEEEPYFVRCWSCGEPAVVTARIVVRES